MSLNSVILGFLTAFEKKKKLEAAMSLPSFINLFFSTNVIFSFGFDLSGSNGLMVCDLNKLKVFFLLIFFSKETKKFHCLNYTIKSVTRGTLLIANVDTNSIKQVVQKTERGGAFSKVLRMSKEIQTSKKGSRA